MAQDLCVYRRIPRIPGDWSRLRTVEPARAGMRCGLGTLFTLPSTCRYRRWLAVPTPAVFRQRVARHRRPLRGHAIVLPINEKIKIHVLIRTQPPLPPKPGKYGPMTRDNIRRYAATTLFAAPAVLDGTAFSRCILRHQHQGFLRPPKDLLATHCRRRIDGLVEHKMRGIPTIAEAYNRYTFFRQGIFTYIDSGPIIVPALDVGNVVFAHRR